MRDRHYNARSGVAGALVLIAFGVLLLLNQNGILHFSDVWRLWPLALVAGGIVRLTQIGSNSRFLGGLMVVLGVILEASEFHLIAYRIRELWPLAIIALGLLLLWQNLQPKENLENSETKWRKFEFPTQAANHLSIFGGGERRINSPDFTRADILAIFGGYKLDLRNAGIKGASAIVDATAIFGGIEILVPETWNVIVRGVGIFGGYGDETHLPELSERAPELIVQGVAIFGGVAIKN
jgi:predicted membrane protein